MTWPETLGILGSETPKIGRKVPPITNLPHSLTIGSCKHKSSLRKAYGREGLDCEKAPSKF